LAILRETVSNLGVIVGRVTADRGNGMKWRVMVELTGSKGAVGTYEVSAGGINTAECSAATVGLTLADGKRTLAGLQDHLVRAQTEEYCRQRRLCSHCGSQRPLKDVRARRLLSVFGTVEVRAPRFSPCRCAVTRRHILNPIAEIMPDRCTPEYERLIAGGSSGMVSSGTTGVGGGVEPPGSSGSSAAGGVRDGAFSGVGSVAD
jgi:hypothetical protein